MMERVFAAVFCISSMMFAQTKANLHGIGGCWKSTTKKVVPLTWSYSILGTKGEGQCSIQVTEVWNACLTEDDNGGLSGELSKLHQRISKEDKTGVEGLMCTILPGATASYSAKYQLKIMDSPAGTSAAATFTKCDLGECPDIERQPLSGKVVLVGPGWSLQLSTREQLQFEKLQPQ